MSGSTFSVPQSALMDTDGQNSSQFLTDCGKINSYIWSSSANPLIYGTDQGRSFKETTFGTSFPFSDHNTFSNFSAYDYRSLPNKSTESDIGGTNVKFYPVQAEEFSTKHGIIQVRFQSITSMPEYKNKSLEELRFEDYIFGRSTFYQQKINQTRAEQYKEPSLLDELLQNVINGPTQNINVTEDVFSKKGPVDVALCGKTPLLLQALLNNIKQRFSLSNLSEETRHHCEKLTSKLMEFTEKTIENIAVIVLEDILNNIKQRKDIGSNITSKETTKSKKSICCKLKSSRKSQRERIKHERQEKMSTCDHKEITKMVNDCSSECDEVTSCERASVQSQEIHSNCTRTSEMSKKKSPKGRREFTYQGRGRESRNSSPHSTLRHRKHEKRCESGNYKYCSCAEEMSSNRSDSTICEHRKNVSSKIKGSKNQHPKNKEDDFKDDCHICEHFRMVSVNEKGREYASSLTKGNKEKNISSRRLMENEKEKDEKNEFKNHSVSKNVNEINCLNETCILKLEEKAETDTPSSFSSDSESI